MKIFKLATYALAAMFVLAACSDDDNGPGGGGGNGDGELGLVEARFYVVNQGNIYSGIAGGIDRVIVSTEASGLPTSYYRDYFSEKNGQSLGDTPQGGIAYGSKIYVPVFGSNLVWVLNRYTLSIIAGIQTTAPEALCADKGYVFVSNNDGHVSRLDTAALIIDKRIAVGPNPFGMTTLGGKLYVAISDGYNYDNNYRNGKRLAVVDLKSFTHTGDIPVGLNPGQVEKDAHGNIFVLCRGNYADVQPEVQKVNPLTQEVTPAFATASFMAVGHSVLYALTVQSDYVNNTATVTSSAIDTRTGNVVKAPLFDQEENPASPVSIQVDAESGDLYVCADRGPMDYDKSGLLYRYDANGKLLHQFETGIHPCGVILY